MQHVTLRALFSFPDPVNEASARLVAGGVTLLALLTIVTGWRSLAVAIAYGFLARVLTGPTLHLQYISRGEAARIEAQLAEALGAAGLFVQGGH